MCTDQFGIAFFLRIKPFRGIKIHELHLAGRGYYQIGRLDIAVDDRRLAGVEIPKDPAQAYRNIKSPLVGQAAFMVQNILQIDTTQILLDHDQSTVILHQLQDLGCVSDVMLLQKLINSKRINRKLLADAEALGLDMFDQFHMTLSVKFRHFPVI